MTVLIVLDGLTPQAMVDLATLCPGLAGKIGPKKLWRGPGEIISPGGVQGQRPEKKTNFPLLPFLFQEAEADKTALPLGYLTALGAGLEPDPDHTYALLDVTHLAQKGQNLIFSGPEDLSMGEGDVSSLMELLRAPFLLEGWHLSPGPGATLLLASEQPCEAATLAFDLLDGRSFREVMPSGPHGAKVVGLLTTGQLLLARASVNRSRQSQGLPPLNTPWIHGLGRGADFPAWKVGPGGGYWCQNWLASGLARRWGMHPLMKEKPAPGVSAKGLELLRQAVLAWQGEGLVFLGFSGVDEVTLPMIHHGLLQPLAQAMEANIILVVAGGEKLSCCWGRGGQLCAKPRFWQRQRLRQGGVLSMAELRDQWRV